MGHVGSLFSSQELNAMPLLRVLTTGPPMEVPEAIL